MDTHGHKEICKVGEGLLKEAFGKAVAPFTKNVTAYHMGNWLTDLSQVYDEITYQKPARWAEEAAVFAEDLMQRLLKCALVDIEGTSTNLGALQQAKQYVAEKWNQTVADALQTAVGQITEFIRESVLAMFGQGGEQGDLSQGLKHLIKVAAWTKYVQDEGMDYDSFENAFNQIMAPIDPTSGDPESKYGLRGAYYPHHHMDRWEAERTPYAAAPTRAQTRTETRNPDIYGYMRDHIEYVAGLLAELDLNWAEPTFDRKVYRPTPDAEEDEQPLPPRSHWTDQQWKAWEIEMDERMALLGHATHVLEDFFAHSTFVEHAFRLWNDPKTRPLAGKVANFFLGNSDYTRFARRLLLFKPQYLQDESGGNGAQTAYQKLNDTPRDAQGNPIEDPNVVTGYFDIRDTIISLEHVAMELFGSQTLEWAFNDYLQRNVEDDKKLEYSHGHSNEPSRYIRKACDWVERPREALQDANEKIKEDTKQKLEDVQKEWNKIKKLPEFDVPMATARAIAQDVLPPDAPPAIVDSLAFGLVAVEKGKVVKGVVASAKSAIEFFSVIAKGKKGIAEWLSKWLANTGASIVISRIVSWSEDQVKGWIGSNRIGCHSLLAKDHDYDYLNDGALECARFVDWYVISTLVRAFDRNELFMCRSPLEGPEGPTEGKNVCNERRWIDWMELLEHFLRHPGGEPLAGEHHTLPGEIIHTTEDGDTLESLGLRYAQTAHPKRKPSDPRQFWRRIAKHNYDTDASREINAHLREAGVSYTVSDGVNEAWKPGTLVRIPDQPIEIAAWREPQLEHKWFYKVLEHGYSRARSGFESEETRQSVPGGADHEPKPITKDQMFTIRNNGMAMAQQWMQRYRDAGLEARSG